MQGVKAQKQDTVYYLMKNTGEIANSKDSADYIIQIAQRNDSSIQKMYMVKEFYMDGKIKLISQAITNTPWPIFRGNSIEFYDNGHKKHVESFNSDSTLEEEYNYYPNGKLYTIIEHVHSKIDYTKINRDSIDNLYIKNNQFKQCNDSTGNILAENGNGKWMFFDSDFKHVTDYGQMLNGYQEGEWHGQSGDTAKYVCTYHLGKVISGTGYDKSEKKYPFTKLIIYPTYKGGVDLFYRFLARNIRYPAIDKENNVSGKVLISFIVEQDSTLSNFKIIREPSVTIGNEVLRVIKLSSPWIPELRYGIITRYKYTVPISFNLGSEPKN